MKLQFRALTLMGVLSCSGFTTTSLAEVYDVTGEIITENITSTLQIGTIEITAIGRETGETFSDIGSLVGNITGTEGMFTTLLSHVSRFSQGNSFVTQDDKAVIVGINDYVDSVPCSFNIVETIDKISRGTRFFQNITSANMTAIGTVSNCPGNNENHFVITGTITKD